MFRSTVSGSGGVWPRSAKVSVHSAPLARPSLSSEGICGRLRRMRMAWPFSSGSRLTSPMMAPPLARIGSTSIGVGMVEHQPHRIGAAEQRSRGRRGKGERHAQAVAVTPRLDGGGLVLGAAFRRRTGCRRRGLLRRLRRRWSLLGRHGLRRFRGGSLDLFGGLRRLSRLPPAAMLFPVRLPSSRPREPRCPWPASLFRRQALPPRPRPALRSPGRA